MLAQVYIKLPFSVTMPEGEHYSIRSYSYEGYEVRIYPFCQSEDAKNDPDSGKMEINGAKAFNADVLHINFLKPEFNREERVLEFDPPLELIFEVANDYLQRLRYVANSTQIQQINFRQSRVAITYLNDDETEIPKGVGLLRGKGTFTMRLAATIFNSDIWESVHSVNSCEEIPVWKTLLLDARTIMPQVGPAVILTFTALEVFISKILDELAKFKKADSELWDWINNRGFFLKNPGLEEQFDFLSNHFLGTSIKKNKELWKHFKNLQAARNSFAHSGIAKFEGRDVDEADAYNFIIRANEMIDFIKVNLPIELHWPEYKHNITYELSKTIST